MVHDHTATVMDGYDRSDDAARHRTAAAHDRAAAQDQHRLAAAYGPPAPPA
jgi:hypothetical protein